MAQRKHAGGTPATVALERAGVAFTQHAYEHDPAATSYGMEAAEVLGLDPATVFKTLLAEVDGRLVVAIVPVTGQLDLKALAASVGGKRAAMADPAVAERSTGYVVGGISPIGQRKRLTTVLDATALDQPTVYVSGGKRGLDLGLDPRDLVTLLDGAGRGDRSRSRLSVLEGVSESRSRPWVTSSSVQALAPNARRTSRLRATSVGVLGVVLADLVDHAPGPSRRRSRRRGWPARRRRCGTVSLNPSSSDSEPSPSSWSA